MEKTLKEILGEQLGIIIRVLQMIKDNLLDVKDLLFFIDELSPEDRKRIRQRRKTTSELLAEIELQMKTVSKNTAIGNLSCLFDFEQLNRELNTETLFDFSYATPKKMSFKEIFDEING